MPAKRREMVVFSLSDDDLEKAGFDPSVITDAVFADIVRAIKPLNRIVGYDLAALTLYIMRRHKENAKHIEEEE
jgi:hypothetical protein